MDNRKWKCVTAAAMLLALGCARPAAKDAADCITLPKPMLDSLGVTVRSAALSAAQAKQFKFLRIYWKAAPATRTSFVQHELPAGAQTLQVAVQRLEGTMRINAGSLLAERNPGAGFSGANAACAIPTDCHAACWDSKPLQPTAGLPQLILALGRNGASNLIDDPNNQVVVYAMLYAERPRD